MPAGMNRNDLNHTGVTFNDGTPVDASTHNFGNQVNQTPAPTNYGNTVGTSGGVALAVVNAIGAGYEEADVVTLISDGDGNAQLTVLSVDDGGGVLTFAVTTAGSGYVVANSVQADGGSGTGFSVNVTKVDNPYGNPVYWTPTPTEFGNVIGGAAPTLVTRIVLTGVYGAGTATHDLTAPLADFTVTADISIPPVAVNVIPGSDWQTRPISAMRYQSTALGLDVHFTGNYFIDIFNADFLGGIDMGADYLDGNYAWEFFADTPPGEQIYSGTEAAPTLVNGVYSYPDGIVSPVTNNQFPFNSYPVTITVSTVAI